MELILKIAWRNVIRHKGKSLVVGIILFLGALIMTFGSGFLSGMNSGISKNFMNKFTGNIVLCPTNQNPDNCVIGEMGGKVPKVMTGYTNIKKILDSRPEISGYTPVCRGMALALSEDGDPGRTMLFGVKFQDYQKLFGTNIRLFEGRALRPNERGVLVTSNSRKELYDFTSYWLKPEHAPFKTNYLTPEAKADLATLLVQTNIVIMGMDASGLAKDIRVPVKGIYNYNQFNTVWQQVNIMDIESFRECFNYITGADAAVKLNKEQEKLLNTSDTNMDSMFGDNVVTTVDTHAAGYDLSQLHVKKTTAFEPVNIDAGSYNLVLVKFKKDISLNKTLKSLNMDLKRANVNAKAVSWRIAVKLITQMIDVINIILYVFVALLYFVAIIIIMNTLTMTALERIPEIGMMRAVGADKSFVQNMFLGETFILSATFGSVGIIAGIILVAFMSSLKIPASSQWTQLIFGGDFFNPMLNVGAILLNIGYLAVVTLLSVTYPTMVARRITPLEAIQRD